MVLRLRKTEIQTNAVEAMDMTVTDGVINTVSEIAQPVVEIQPRFSDKIVGVVRSTTGTGTAVALDSNRDFMLKTVQFGYVKDATCDSTNIQLILTPYQNNTSTVTGYLYQIPLTATADHAEITFPDGLRLKRGSNLSIASTFTVGTTTFWATFIGRYI